MAWLSLSKQVVGQLDSLDVAGQVVALAVEQTVGLSTDAERRLDAVKPDLVVLGDVAVIEGQRKSRMVADAEAELFLPGICCSRACMFWLQSGKQYCEPGKRRTGCGSLGSEPACFFLWRP